MWPLWLEQIVMKQRDGTHEKSVGRPRRGEDPPQADQFPMGRMIQALVAEAFFGTFQRDSYVLLVPRTASPFPLNETEHEQKNERKGQEDKSLLMHSSKGIYYITWPRATTEDG